jgi:O-antigen ligase
MDLLKQNPLRYTIPLDFIKVTLIPLLLILSFFILPLGGNLRNVVFPWAGLAIFLIPEYRKQLWALMPTPYILPMFLFYVWIIIACFWGPATGHEQLFVLQKYSKLLLFGLFALGFRDPHARAWSLYAFITAALVPCLLSITNAYGIYKYKDIQDPGHVFVNHVATGFVLAFVSYLCFFLSAKHQGWKRIGLIALGILFSFQVLFINTGRTGYVVFVVLMLILFIQIFSWRKAFFAAAIFTMLFSLSYLFSPVMQSGVQFFMADVKHYQENNKNTSLGFRMQFHDYAKSLFIKHPILGSGTGAYTHDFDKDNPTPSFKDRANPHSQYWLVLVEQGMIGLILLIFTFISLMYIAFHAPEYGPILFAFLIIVCLSNFTDSILLLSPIGQILVILSSLCLGELLNRSRKHFIAFNASKCNTSKENS